MFAVNISCRRLSRPGLLPLASRELRRFHDTFLCEKVQVAHWGWGLAVNGCFTPFPATAACGTRQLWPFTYNLLLPIRFCLLDASCQILTVYASCLPAHLTAPFIASSFFFYYFVLAKILERLAGSAYVLSFSFVCLIRIGGGEETVGVGTRGSRIRWGLGGWTSEGRLLVSAHPVFFCFFFSIPGPPHPKCFFHPPWSLSLAFRNPHLP